MAETLSFPARALLPHGALVSAIAATTTPLPLVCPSRQSNSVILKFTATLSGGNLICMY